MLTACSTSDGYYEIARYRIKGNGGPFWMRSRHCLTTPLSRLVAQLYNGRDELVPRHLSAPTQRFDSNGAVWRWVPTDPRPLRCYFQFHGDLQRHGTVRAVEHIPRSDAGVYAAAVPVRRVAVATDGATVRLAEHAADAAAEERVGVDVVQVAEEGPRGPCEWEQTEMGWCWRGGCAGGDDGCWRRSTVALERPGIHTPADADAVDLD